MSYFWDVLYKTHNQVTSLTFRFSEVVHVSLQWRYWYHLLEPMLACQLNRLNRSSNQIQLYNHKLETYIIQRMFGFLSFIDKKGVSEKVLQQKCSFSQKHYIFQSFRFHITVYIFSWRSSGFWCLMRYVVDILYHSYLFKLIDNNAVLHLILCNQRNQQKILLEYFRSKWCSVL